MRNADRALTHSLALRRARDRAGPGHASRGNSIQGCPRDPRLGAARAAKRAAEPRSGSATRAERPSPSSPPPLLPSLPAGPFAPGPRPAHRHARPLPPLLPLSARLRSPETSRSSGDAACRLLPPARVPRRPRSRVRPPARDWRSIRVDPADRWNRMHKTSRVIGAGGAAQRRARPRRRARGGRGGYVRGAGRAAGARRRGLQRGQTRPTAARCRRARRVRSRSRRAAAPRRAARCRGGFAPCYA